MLACTFTLNKNNMKRTKKQTNKTEVLFICTYFLYVLFVCRDLLHFSHSSLPSTTALTHIKSRALLSIETDSSLSRYDPSYPHDNSALPPTSHALVSVSAEVSSKLEERLKRWKLHIGKGLEQPSQQHVCSCPQNETRKLNMTNIRL